MTIQGEITSPSASAGASLPMYGGPIAAMGHVSHWVNAARFALYTRMHTTAQEYLNKATLLALLSESDDCSDEIERLAADLRARMAGTS